MAVLDTLTGCRKAYCGDGIQNINTEECDGRDFGERSCTSYRQGLVVLFLNHNSLIARDVSIANM